MKHSITCLGMPKQKLGPNHDAPLRCDLIKTSLSLTSGISKDFRMAHLFLLSLLVILCLCRKNLVASRNERELQTLSTKLSLNDPSLSTVQFQYRNYHFHLFCTRITSNLVSQISRFVSISVNASQSKTMLLSTTTTLHFLLLLSAVPWSFSRAPA